MTREKFTFPMRKIGKFFFLPIFLRNLFLFIHIFQKNSLFFYNIHFYFISNSQNNHTFTLYYNHSKRETVFKQNSKKFFQKKIHSPIKFGLTYISFFIFYSFLLEHPSLGCSNFFYSLQGHTPPVLAQRWSNDLRRRPQMSNIVKQQFHDIRILGAQIALAICVKKIF